MPDLVLIHSTGQGAAGWDRLVRALAERARRAHAVELPSDPDLDDVGYAALVREQVGDVESPIVLAHSGSGPLLPAAARALVAIHQVWLAAWVPDPARSFVDDVDANLDAAFDPGWVGKDPVEDDEAAIEFVYHDCDGDMLAWALSTRRPFVPEAVYDQRISLAPEIGSTYIVARYDRTIRPTWQRHMARTRLNVEPLEIGSGHCPNVSQPDRLAAILTEVAELVERRDG
jgi:pimeloyl-ACP methyl ester carboxylesterase